jgi:hypothetical protein
MAPLAKAVWARSCIALRSRTICAVAMKPETNTVVHCLRVFLSSADGASLHEVFKGMSDWQRVEAEAALQGVSPVVENALLQYASNFVPEEVLQRCRARLTQLAQKNILWLREWQGLLQTFDEAAIPVISFKGPALAVAAYGNLGLREFHDLDLLIYPHDVALARDRLLDEGYVLWSPVAGDTAESLLQSKNRQLRFTNRERGTTVDLHWGLLHEMFSFQFDVDETFNSACRERHEGIEFLSLSPEYLLLYLCAHGTKNCWSNLSELCDVAAHIQSHREIDWNGCIRLAEENGCELLLRHALLLCERVLRIETPERMKQQYRQDGTTIALSKSAEKFLCLGGEARPGYMRTLRYHLAFAKTWQERTRLIFLRVFSPAESDWQQVRLPRRLFGLYYVVRPLRFLQEQRSKLMRSQS